MKVSGTIEDVVESVIRIYGAIHRKPMPSDSRPSSA